VQHTQPVIAIVDDDPAICRALSRLLQTVGWQAVAFSSAEAFLQSGVQKPPHCLVLDVRLPGMTGLELVERLVADGASFPIIIITGHADAQVHMRAIQAGAVAYLRKPVDEQDFLQAIRHSLGPQLPEP
jgi:two-component system, LuxR family, response regulator FixJ